MHRRALCRRYRVRIHVQIKHITNQKKNAQPDKHNLLITQVWHPSITQCRLSFITDEVIALPYAFATPRGIKFSRSSSGQNPDIHALHLFGSTFRHDGVPQDGTAPSIPVLRGDIKAAQLGLCAWGPTPLGIGAYCWQLCCYFRRMRKWLHFTNRRFLVPARYRWPRPSLLR